MQRATTIDNNDKLSANLLESDSSTCIIFIYIPSRRVEYFSIKRQGRR